MAANPENIPVEEQTNPPPSSGANANQKSNAKPPKSKGSSDQRNTINCKVFLPDGTSVDVDVDVS